MRSLSFSDEENDYFRTFYGQYTAAPNLSKGFHTILFEYIKRYGIKDAEVLLVAENPVVIPIIRREVPDLGRIDTLCYDGKVGEFYEVDLCKSGYEGSKYDIILCQAVLEHTCRPSVVIENLVNQLKSEGILILHTHNLEMPYHAVPIDCCRFFLDFFLELERYINAQIIRYDIWKNHICIVYKNTN